MIPLTSLVDVNSGAAVDPAIATKLFRYQLGPTKIQPHYRVTNFQLQPQSVLPKPKYWKAAWDTSEITRLVMPGSDVASCDISRKVQKQLSLILLDSSLDPAYTGDPNGAPPAGFDPRKHLIHVSQQFTAGGVSIEVPMGFYWCFLPARAIAPGSRLLSYQLAGLTALVDYPMLNNWSFPAGYADAAAGSGYTGMARRLLISPGLPKSKGGLGQTDQGNDDAGPGVPASMIDIDDQGNQQLAVPILVTRGASRLDEINKKALGDSINYRSLWERNRPNNSSVLGDFHLVSSPAPVAGNGVPPTVWDFSTDPTLSIVTSPVQQEFSVQSGFQTGNIALVSAGQTAAGGSDFVGLSYNENPDSALSIWNTIGLDGGPRAMPIVETNSSVANQDMANLRARILTEIGAESEEKITVDTLPMPLPEPGDLVICQVTDKTGTILVPSDPSNPFREIAWTAQLDAKTAKTTRTFKRVVPT